MSTETLAKDFNSEPRYPQWGQPPNTPSQSVDDVDDGLDVASNRLVKADDVPDTHGDLPAVWGPDTGATTAEYAITTLAACGFAALLVIILKSEPIKELVSGVIETALGLGV